MVQWVGTSGDTTLFDTITWIDLLRSLIGTSRRRRVMIPPIRMRPMKTMKTRGLFVDVIDGLGVVAFILKEEEEEDGEAENGDKN
ncbi:hypothetical protein M0R45_021956 [Rubus argutus]|uniref:Uncharacterized protein n=1 Tax=Rubus argutus TaxID=59490 RepID=A0AAW1XDZ0_RUBAR